MLSGYLNYPIFLRHFVSCWFVAAEFSRIFSAEFSVALVGGPLAVPRVQTGAGAAGGVIVTVTVTVIVGSGIGVGSGAGSVVGASVGSSEGGVTGCGPGWVIGGCGAAPVRAA